MRRRKIGVIATIAGMLAAGCGGGGGTPESATTSPGASTPHPEPSSTLPEAPGATATAETPAATPAASAGDTDPAGTPDYDPAAAWADVELPAVNPGTDLLGSSVARPHSEGWTLLYYGIADTDLEPFLMGDLAELGAVGTGAGVNIVSLLDRSPEYSDEPVLDMGDWSGAKLVEIGQGTGTELLDLGDTNTGDPQTLADFIATGVANYPAEHYALVLSDHGAAWPGVGPDESSGYDVMDVPELYAGIQAGLAGAGIDQVDLLGFDACLMATYEVASTLAPLARRLLASQELEPGHGWDYTSFQILNDDPSTDVDTLGAALVDGFAAQAGEWGTTTEITLSLVDLEQLPAVDAAVAGFTAALGERAGLLGAMIGQTRAATLSFGRSPDPEMDTHMTDLGILASRIGVEALDVSDQADALVRAINDAVVYKVEGQATQGATGLSVYFPPQLEYFSQSYTYLPGSYHWSQFLEAYYGAGAAIPEDEQPKFLNADGAAEVGFDDYGLWITGTFDSAAADNVSEAWIEYGIVDADGTVTYIGQEEAEIADDGSGLVTGAYDLTALQLTDGVDSALAYLELVWDDAAGIGTIDIPMAYAPPGAEPEDYEDLLLEVTYDAESLDVISETYYTYDATAGTFGELTADPTGLLFPQLYVENAAGEAGWVPTTDVGLWADLPNLLYEFPDLDPGTTLYVKLVVTDFGGNSDFVSAVVEIP